MTGRESQPDGSGGKVVLIRASLELERETRRLQRKLTQAETIIGIQKKVATRLGIPLQSVDDDEHD